MNEEVKQVTLSQMQKMPSQNGAAVIPGFNSESGFALMQRQAKMLAASTLVPAQYTNNLSNCVIALEMANRVGASPLMVMQNLYVVHGRPGWSAKFLIASFNQCGRFSSIRYEWKGSEKNDDFGCKAWAIEKSTGAKVESPWITWALVRGEKWDQKPGSKWKTMPEKMFMYRAAAWLVDTVAPEISMGLQTEDQIADTYDAEIDDSGTYQVTTKDLAKTDDQTSPEFTLQEALSMLESAKNLDDADAALSTASSLLSQDDMKAVMAKYNDIVGAM